MTKVDFLLSLPKEVWRVASKLMKEMQIAIHKRAEEHQGTTCRILNQQNAIKKTLKEMWRHFPKGSDHLLFFSCFR